MNHRIPFTIFFFLTAKEEAAKTTTTLKSAMDNGIIHAAPRERTREREREGASGREAKTTSNDDVSWKHSIKNVKPSCIVSIDILSCIFSLEMQLKPSLWFNSVTVCVIDLPGSMQSICNLARRSPSMILFRFCFRMSVVQILCVCVVVEANIWNKTKTPKKNWNGTTLCVNTKRQWWWLQITHILIDAKFQQKLQLNVRLAFQRVCDVTPKSSAISYIS